MISPVVPQVEALHFGAEVVHVLRGELVPVQRVQAEHEETRLAGVGGVEAGALDGRQDVLVALGDLLPLLLRVHVDLEAVFLAKGEVEAGLHAAAAPAVEAGAGVPPLPGGDAGAAALGAGREGPQRVGEAGPGPLGAGAMPAATGRRGAARGAGWERAAPSGGTSGCGGVREGARRAGSARRVGLKREPRLLLSLRGPWGCCRWHSYGAVLLVLSRRRRRRCRLEWRWERRCGPKWSELGSEKRA